MKYHEFLSMKHAKASTFQTSMDYHRLDFEIVWCVYSWWSCEAYHSYHSSQSNIRYCVTNKEIFEMLNNTHLTLYMVVRMMNRVNQNKNVMQEVIMLYLKVCILKLKCQRRRLVLKTILMRWINVDKQT